MYKLLLQVPWILLNFHSGIFGHFYNAMNGNSAKNLVFSGYEEVFSSFNENMVTDLLRFHETALGDWMRQFIGASSSDSAVMLCISKLNV